MTAPRIRYSTEAMVQVEALLRHYDALERIEAARNLASTLADAERRIARQPEKGLPAPRPYPELAAPGEAWIKAGRYWVAYTKAPAPMIFAVFHESADILGRYHSSTS